MPRICSPPRRRQLLLCNQRPRSRKVDGLVDTNFKLRGRTLLVEFRLGWDEAQ